MPRSISYKKKRTFTGNQYTKHASQDTNITPRPNNKPSSSKKKLSYLQLPSDSSDVNIGSNVSVVLDLDFLTSFISLNSKCQFCDSVGSLVVSEDENKKKGWSLVWF